MAGPAGRRLHSGGRAPGRRPGIERPRTFRRIARSTRRPSTPEPGRRASPGGVCTRAEAPTRGTHPMRTKRVLAAVLGAGLWTAALAAPGATAQSASAVPRPGAQRAGPGLATDLVLLHDLDGTGSWSSAPEAGNFGRLRIAGKREVTGTWCGILGRVYVADEAYFALNER